MKNLMLFVFFNMYFIGSYGQLIELDDNNIKSEFIKDDIAICDLGKEVFNIIEAKNYQMIIAGETFGQKKNEEFLLSLFEYLLSLNQNYTLVLEVPYSIEFLFNYWLLNEKEFYIDGKKNALKEYSKEKYKSLFKKLYDFKKEEGLLFEVRGIDIEKNLVYSLSIVNVFLSYHKDQLSDTLHDYHNSIDSLIRYHDTYDELKELSLSLNSYYELNKGPISKSLGDFKIPFERILKGIVNGIKYYQIENSDGLIKAGNYREEILYENLKNIIAKNTDNKIFAQIGTFHLLNDSLMSLINYNGQNLNKYSTISKFLNNDMIPHYSIWYWYKKETVKFYQPYEAEKITAFSELMKGKLGIINLRKWKRDFPILNSSFDSIIISGY